MKAILVMDMPSSCLECPIGKDMSIAIETCIQCPLGKCAIDAETEIRPDWCPLRPAPEKRHSNDNLMELLADIVRNACIDEILGDKE